MKINNNLDNLLKIFGFLCILAICSYLYFVTSSALSKVIMISGLFFVEAKPKEKTGIAETKVVTLKLGNEYLIDVPQNYIKYHKQLEHPEQNKEISLWAVYPTFEGFSPNNSTMFNAELQDNNLVQFKIFPFLSLTEQEELERSKRFGQKGVKGLLEAHKNYRKTPQEQQLFSNPTEYAEGIKSKLYIYFYNSGEHAVAINCLYGKVDKPFTHKRCKASKVWGNSIGLSYDFGLSNMNNFGRIEKSVDKLLKKFNLRKIKNG